jgi:hypothetical protein
MSPALGSPEKRYERYLIGCLRAGWALVSVKLPDPTRQRPQFGRFHPPRRLVEYPQHRSIEVLQEAAPRSARLTDVAHLSDIARI